jgi:2-polyprenyl-6-methoxyphenol hydroxylase-like FAD-dependent oxidoreductase
VGRRASTWRCVAATWPTACTAWVEFLFNDSIAVLDESDDRVDVTFDSGTRRTFDLVIGADGLHSNIRRLVFGPEEQFHHYLGYAFAGFTMPNDLGLEHEAITLNVSGRAAVFFAHELDERVHGFLNFAQDKPPFDAFNNPGRNGIWSPPRSPTSFGRSPAWSPACATPTTSLRRRQPDPHAHLVEGPGRQRWPRPTRLQPRQAAQPRWSGRSIGP